MLVKRILGTCLVLSVMMMPLVSADVTEGAEQLNNWTELEFAFGLCFDEMEDSIDDLELQQVPASSTILWQDCNVEATGDFVCIVGVVWASVSLGSLATTAGGWARMNSVGAPVKGAPVEGSAYVLFLGLQASKTCQEIDSRRVVIDPIEDSHKEAGMKFSDLYNPPLP